MTTEQQRPASRSGSEVIDAGAHMAVQKLFNIAKKVQSSDYGKHLIQAIEETEREVGKLIEHNRQLQAAAVSERGPSEEDCQVAAVAELNRNPGKYPNIEKVPGGNELLPFAVEVVRRALARSNERPSPP